MPTVTRVLHATFRDGETQSIEFQRDSIITLGRESLPILVVIPILERGTCVCTVELREHAQLKIEARASLAPVAISSCPNSCPLAAITALSPSKGDACREVLADTLEGMLVRRSHKVRPAKNSRELLRAIEGLRK